jgi:hypothetical protein
MHQREHKSHSCCQNSLNISNFMNVDFQFSLTRDSIVWKSFDGVGGGFQYIEFQAELANVAVHEINATRQLKEREVNTNMEALV